jgi:hypothetical protein
MWHYYKILVHFKEFGHTLPNHQIPIFVGSQTKVVYLPLNSYDPFALSQLG